LSIVGTGAETSYLWGKMEKSVKARSTKMKALWFALIIHQLKFMYKFGGELVRLAKLASGDCALMHQTNGPDELAEMFPVFVG
jgi:hypothetical protein